MKKSTLAIYRAPLGRGAEPTLFVHGFGMQSIRTHLAKRQLPHHGLVWIEQGKGAFWTEISGHHRVVGPAVFFLFPGVAHGYGPDPGTQWQERWVLFSGTLCSQLEAQGIIDRRDPFARIATDGALSSLFGDLHSELIDHTPLAHATAAATAHRLILKAAKAARERQRDATNNGDAAIEAIRSRALEPLDMAALAAAFGLSPATLRRHCRSVYGVPPKVLQTRIRIDRAKQLLALDDRSIEQIAQAVGYQDSFYFARVFSHHEGCAPTIFRQRNRRV